MISLADLTLERLQACHRSGKPVPPQVLGDAIECLSRARSLRQARAARDRMIRMAGKLSGGPCPQACARELIRQATALERVWPRLLEQAPPDAPQTVRDALHLARWHAQLPDSERQFLRILQTANEG